MRELHDIAKSKKTMVIRGLIETTMNRSHQSFYKWANYNMYAKTTETNIRKMNLIRDTIEVSQNQLRAKLMRIMLLTGKFRMTK